MKRKPSTLSVRIIFINEKKIIQVNINVYIDIVFINEKKTNDKMYTHLI